MRAVLVRNADDGDPGFIGERAEHKGVVLDPLDREDHDGWPADPLAGAELVILLGSEWSVYWPHNAEPVAAEAALVRAAHERGTPVLGICYGAQLVAHALGGSVAKAPFSEIGWYTIDSDAPSAIVEGPWFQWHHDVFVVPPGARELARSAAGPQAFITGRTFAVQFHPEVDEDIVRRWATLGERLDLMERTASETPRSRIEAHRLFDWFCNEVAGV